MADTFIFAKIPSNGPDLVWDEDGIIDLCDYNCVSLNALLFGNENDSWADGYVLRTNTLLSSRALYEIAKERFDILPSWAIFQLGDAAIETPDNGSIKTFRWASNQQPFAQIYLLAMDSDFSFGSAIEDILKVFKGKVSHIVFQFKDGAILFVAVHEPATITANRCFRILQRFRAWAVVDHEGTTSNSSGVDVWRDPYEIEDFEDDDS